MARVRILGPKARLEATLPVLQDFGRMHVTPPRADSGVDFPHWGEAPGRHERQLRRARSEVRRSLDALRLHQPTRGEGTTTRRDIARWLRVARNVAREAESLRARSAALEEERALLSRYRPFFSMFDEMSETLSRGSEVTAYFVLLPESAGRHLARLREGLSTLVGDAFELWTRPLASGGTGALILVPRGSGDALDDLISTARLEEIALPGRDEGLTPAESIQRIAHRLDEIPEEADSVQRSLDELRREHGPMLLTAEAALADELARIDVAEWAGETQHAYVVEGWVPEAEVGRLRRELSARVGDTTVVEEVEREEWIGADTPVVLHNPRLFRPFERLVGIVPLPRYGSVDPTPFLAIFFPMFFGLVLGDIGYGLLLGMGALVLRLRSEEGSTLRAVAEIAGACAVFAVIFGALYGELFGDAGARLLGIEAVVFHREDALVPFLGLALAIGVVHTVLGLVLNLISKLRVGRREAIGPGVTLLMVTLVVAALLAAVDVIPGRFFTPFVIAVLALFPILVAAEGILGPTELLSTLGHVLSYARVMAVGTASVMMAVAANRMVGAFGSVLVGVVFALLFHLVNFVLGMFSPTVHALRLHFVEFFGTFYSPGGTRYEPFRHWSPDSATQPKEQA